jgi:hypothetical protein
MLRNAGTGHRPLKLPPGLSESVSDTFASLYLACGTRKVAQKWRRKIFPAPDQEGMIPQKLLMGRPLRLEPAIGFEPMTC